MPNSIILVRLVGLIFAIAVAQPCVLLPSMFPGQSAAVAQPPAANNNPVNNAGKKYRYWNSNWDFDDIDVGKLVSRLESVGIELPVDVAGKITAKFKVGVPLNGLRDAAAYRINGSVSSRSLQVATLGTRDFYAGIDYSGGNLRLSGVRARISDEAIGVGGALSAEIAAGLSPKRDLRMNVALDSVPINPITKLVGLFTENDAAGSIAGLVTGKLKFDAPLQQLSDVSSWDSTGDLSVASFQKTGTPAFDVSTGPFQIAGGKIQAKGLRIAATADRSVALAGSIAADLNDDKRFEFQIRGNDFPLDVLTQLTPADPIAIGDDASDPDVPAVAAAGTPTAKRLIDGKLDLDITGSGALGQGSISDGNWTIDGRIASPGITVFGQTTGLIEHRLNVTQKSISIQPLSPGPDDRMRLRSLSANYIVGENEIRLDSLDAEALRGSLSGSAVVARQPTGVHQFNLKWDNLNPELDRSALVSLIGNVPFITSARSGGLSKTAISLTTSGAIDWTVPADKLDQPSAHRGDATISFNDFKIGSAAVGAGTIRLATDGQTVDLAGDGTLLGGRFEVSSGTEITSTSTWGSVASGLAASMFEIKNLQLGQLLPIIRPTDRRRYQGTVSVIYDSSSRGGDLSSDGNQPAADQFAALIESFSIDSTSISRRLLIEGRLLDDLIILDEITGSYAGGTLTASGEWSLGDGPRQIQVRLVAADASRGLKPISDTIANLLGGSISGDVSITDGDRIRIAGRVAVRGSELINIGTGELDSPLQISLAPDLSYWSVSFPSIRGDSYGGRLLGELSLNRAAGGLGFDMDGEFQSRRVDFGALLATTGSASSIAHGRVDGMLTIGGRRIQTLKDLRGQFAFDLDRTTGEAVPGLAEASRFFTGITLGNTSFGDGAAEGSIGGGAVKIDQLTLSSRQVAVAASGRVDLRSLRLDLRAIISTGSFQIGSVGNSPAGALAGRLVVSSFLPGVTLLELGQLVSNRTVYVSISGPLSSPIVRLLPIETAEAALERFVINQIIPSLIGGGLNSTMN